MEPERILKTGILAAQSIFRPTTIPVDYCGTIVYNLSLHLTDGTFLTCSSLEPAVSGGGEEERFEATLALLQQRVAKSGMRPRCDYFDAPLTLAYRKGTGKPLPVFVASACLCGEHCRYDGGAGSSSALALSGEVLPVCPELFGGLAIPRMPCELAGGHVVDSHGNDHTAAFTVGAQKTLALAQTFGISQAILKAKSPSCGISQVYDGTFSRTLVAGEGICAALLREAGFALRGGDGGYERTGERENK